MNGNIINNLKLMLIQLFIMIFLSLFLYTFLKRAYYKVKNLEPMTGKDDSKKESESEKKYTDPGLDNDALYLSKLNASNISYLKEQLDDILSIRSVIGQMQSKIQSNTLALQNMSNSLSGVTTGAIPDRKTTTELANSDDMSIKYNN